MLTTVHDAATSGVALLPPARPRRCGSSARVPRDVHRAWRLAGRSIARWRLLGPATACVCALATPNATAASYNTVSTVDDSGSDVVGLYTSIAIGADGLPVISYYDDTHRALKIAHCEDAACASAATITTVDDDPNTIEGRYGAIAIGDDGLPVVSYQGGTGDTLKVAKCVDVACASPATITEVDDPPTIGGTFTSIAIGNNGRPVISYTDDGLKVARCGNSECTGIASVTTVDNSAPLTGYHTSIAIGFDGFPVIAYRDQTNGLLKTAKCGNSACTNVVAINELDAGGEYAAIAVRFDGIPLVTHFGGDGALMLAQCGNTSCNAGPSLATLLDPPSDVVGMYTDIVIGPAGRAFISHHNVTQGALMVTICLTSDCFDGTLSSTLDTRLDGAAPLGKYTSIALGADGLPVISYFDAEAGALKVAQCGSRACDGLFRDGFE